MGFKMRTTTEELWPYWVGTTAQNSLGAQPEPKLLERHRETAGDLLREVRLGLVLGLLSRCYHFGMLARLVACKDP